MNKFFKYTALIVGVLFVLLALVLPNKEPISPRMQQIYKFVDACNRILPRPAGTIGMVDSVNFDGHNIAYYYTINGNEALLESYKKEKETYKTIFMYHFMIMNGQNGVGDIFVDFMRDLNFGIRHSFCVNYEFVDIVLSYEDYMVFDANFRRDPIDAFLTTFELERKIMSEMPSEIGPYSPFNTLDEPSLFDIKRDQDTIIFTYNQKFSDEELTNLKNIEPYKEEFLMTYLEDPDAKELFTILCLAHANLSLRYINVYPTDTCEIAIPYELIKKHCTITHKEMLN